RRCSTQCTVSPGSGCVKRAAVVSVSTSLILTDGSARPQPGSRPESTFAGMTFDVKRIRSRYPALQGPTVYLDGAAGTQSPDVVIDAIAQAYRGGTSNAGGAFASSARADAYTSAAR